MNTAAIMHQVYQMPAIRVGRFVVPRIIAWCIVAIVHVLALKALLLNPGVLRLPALGTVTSVQILGEPIAKETPLPPPIMSFKKPMPVIWRPHIEVSDTTITQNPQPMVIIGSRLNPDFSNDFPNSAYPIDARNAGEEGTVVLSLQILEDGRVGDVLLDKNSGFNSLDGAAITFVKKHWRFIPMLRDGVAVVDWKTVSIDFRLSRIDVHW